MPFANKIWRQHHASFNDQIDVLLDLRDEISQRQ